MQYMENNYFDDFNTEDLDDGTDFEDGQQEMFEHFRLELDKGQAPMRVDNMAIAGRPWVFMNVLSPTEICTKTVPMR